MVLKRTAAITGAFSYTGSYIARAFLDRGWDVITLTRGPQRPHELQSRVKAFPLDFSHPDQIEANLRGVHTLANTYWVRFNYPGSSFNAAVENSRTLIAAAERAGVKRIIHISVSNPDIRSSLPYYRGKAEVEQIVQSSKMSWAILQPTLIFGTEEVLAHNIAWLLRHFPIFAIGGDGHYRVQPIFVEDLAKMAANAASTTRNEVLPAAGPEVYTFTEFIDLIKKVVGSRALVLRTAPWLTLLMAKLVGLLLGDITLTREELQGLMEERLYVGEPALAPTRLSDWARENRANLGLFYRNELKRHHLPGHKTPTRWSC
jgi:uncharacterized protein YbjT (DUF2867 family)